MSGLPKSLYNCFGTHRNYRIAYGVRTLWLRSLHSRSFYKRITLITGRKDEGKQVNQPKSILEECEMQTISNKYLGIVKLLVFLKSTQKSVSIYGLSIRGYENVLIDKPPLCEKSTLFSIQNRINCPLNGFFIGISY